MTLPKYTPRGGFKRPMRIGDFILEYLSGGVKAYGHEIYAAYKERMQLISYTDPRKMGHRRRCINFQGFSVYLSCARRLGLIEYCNPDGSTPGAVLITEPAIYPQASERRYNRLTSGAESSSAWSDLQGAAKGIVNPNPSDISTP